MKTIHLIAAARPNFMKIAPLWHEIYNDGELKPVLVHTGQHHDENMSGSFFRDLNLPTPDIHLGIKGTTHAEQTGGVMIAYEKVCLELKPHLVVVVGDVNSTMACALAAKKQNFLIAHLEAGLRSHDMSMPEEINRVVTDRISDILWTPSPDGDQNLIKEGVDPSRISRVGNIMIDSFEMMRDQIETREINSLYSISDAAYCMVTFHRPSNVDDQGNLNLIVKILLEIAINEKIIFPIHPRTLQRLEQGNLLKSIANNPNIITTPPLGYLDFMRLLLKAKYVLTDSGGIQEETSYLGIPCFTLRENTERPITITAGTNKLVSMSNALDVIIESSNYPGKQRPKIDLWDGKSACRIINDIKTRLL